MTLCFDGGGSFSRMMLVDDRFNLMGEGKSSGVNTNHTPIEEVRMNLKSCLDETLAGRVLTQEDEAVITMVGPLKELESLLSPFGCQIRLLGEAQAALWAGAFRTSGYVALSGTGSNVSCMNVENRNTYIGGLGLLLGDEGSGAWIGQQALRAVVGELNGTGIKTALTGKVKKYLGAQTIWEIIRKMYDSPSYVRFLAALVPEAAEAAEEGDKTALSLFGQAGEHMARQLLWLINENKDTRKNLFCVLSGGVWKAHPHMYETFFDKLRKNEMDITIKKPYFEPVMAGIVQKLSLQEPSWPEEKKLFYLSEKLPGYLYKML